MPQVIFNIATVERRRGMFMEVLKDLSRQNIPCDKINVAISCKHGVDVSIHRFLDNHFASHQIINAKELQCEFKMFALGQKPHSPEFRDAYFMTFDDDIIYPVDYSQKMIAGIEKYRREAVVGFHGIKFDKFPVINYKAQKTMHQYFKTIAVDTPVDVIGTGCLGFYVDSLLSKGFDFDKVNKKINCLDGSFGRWCRDNRMNTIVLSHMADWMKIYPDSQDMQSLWKRSWAERYKTKLSFLQQ